MSVIGVKLDLFLAFNEHLDVFLCSKYKAASFVISLAHDMDF